MDAGAVDAGAHDGGVVDAGTADGGADAAVDLRCGQLELSDGGCQPLSFASLCELRSLTVLATGSAADDQAAASLGAAIVSSCAPPPTLRTVNTGDPTVLDSNGAPLAARTDSLIAAGGGDVQPFVKWLERSGNSPVLDTSSATVASLSRRDGGVIFSAPFTEFDAGADVFLLEFARSSPGAPVAVVAYGYYGPGTTAASWYFQHRLLTQPGAYPGSWYVVRWTDLDGDQAPSAGDQFSVLGSGQ